MVCARTGLPVYVGSTVTGGLCQDWSAVYAGCTVIGGLCQDWSVSVCW